METSETIKNEDHEENCTFIGGATQAKSGEKVSNRAKMTLLGGSLVMVKVVLTCASIRTLSIEFYTRR